MPTDDERREVARRLREIRPCKSGHIKWWEIARALGLKQPAGWFGWEKFEPDSANRLADLIEPGEPKVRCVAEIKIDDERLEQLVNDAVVEVTGIDRDALLALADEYGNSSKVASTYKWSDPTCASMATILAEEYGKTARRIREALGVVDGQEP